MFWVTIREDHTRANFFKTEEALFQLVIPCFKAGIENNEFCLLIMFNQKQVEHVIGMLKASDPGLIKNLEKKSIEIVDYKTLYFRDGHFDDKEVHDDINKRQQKCINRWL